jgi:hypothetical protein
MKFAIEILEEIRKQAENGVLDPKWTQKKCDEALEDLEDDEVRDELDLDIEAIFEKYGAKVSWCDTMYDRNDNPSPLPEKYCHWRLDEKYGSMDLEGCQEIADARLAAALFLYLWGEKRVPVAIAHRCAVASVRTYNIRPIDDDDRARLVNALKPEEERMKEHIPLKVQATKSHTEIWIGDSEGHFVQKGEGTLETKLLPGEYNVSFGSGSPAKVFQLREATEIRENEFKLYRESWDDLAGINIGKDAISLPAFISRRECPECEEGVLLGRRDSETLEMLKVDNCTLCGQQFTYDSLGVYGEFP